MDAVYAYFEQIARLGSIRKAAEYLNVSPSSISRQILRLEDEFGLPLLVRHAHGVKLTPAGQILARFVHNRSREFLRLRGQIDELKSLERGHVSICTVEGMLGGGVLPRALAAFSRQHPGLTYEIIVKGADGVVRAVAEDRCDIGIAFEPRANAGVEIVADLAQPVLAVVEPGHPLAKRTSLTLDDFRDLPVGLPDGTFGIRHTVDTAMAACDFKLRVQLETNSIDMVRQFALHGMGVGFLPMFAFEREAWTNSLIGVPVDHPLFASSTTQICRNATIEPTWAARAMIKALTDPSTLGFVLR